MRMKSLREQIAELDDPAPKEFDPESHDVHPNHGSDTDDDRPESALGDFDGREHYEEVAPSRLRKPVKPVLGQMYAGSQVRREDLFDGAVSGDERRQGPFGKDFRIAEDPFAPMDESSDDDPFAKGISDGSDSEHASLDSSHGEGRKKMRRVSFSVPKDEDEEIYSDEAFGGEDDPKFKRFKFLGSRSKKKTRDGGSENEYIADVSSSDERMDVLQVAKGTSLLGPESESENESLPMSEDEFPQCVDFSESPSSEALSDISDSAPLTTKATKRPVAEKSRAELKALLSSDAAAVASSLSAAASADAKKGRAVKDQYQTFDRLLDARIKLQKGLTAANLMSPDQDVSENKDAAQAAEEAASKLWNTITSMRHLFAETQSQGIYSDNERKRKRSPHQATSSTPISTLWSTAQSLNSTTIVHHRAVLNKWSAKVRASNPTAIAAESRSRPLNNDKSNASHKSITSVIDAYLATETSKLVAQSASTTSNPTAGSDHETKDKEKPNPTMPLSYDDTPFYQSLLHDLISSRQSTALQPPQPPPTTTRLHPPGSKNKHVDTRASKGRQIRYTVHEKLQNFMAAEGWAAGGGGGTWSEEARDEFFASLMGNNRGGRRFLDEEREGEMDAVE